MVFFPEALIRFSIFRVNLNRSLNSLFIRLRSFLLDSLKFISFHFTINFRLYSKAPESGGGIGIIFILKPAMYACNALFEFASNVSMLCRGTVVVIIRLIFLQNIFMML